MPWRGDYLTKCDIAKRRGRKKPPAIRVGGARQVMRWAWSKGYRAHVTAQVTAQGRWLVHSPRYADDATLSGDSVRGRSEELKYRMRAALGVLEARGVKLVREVMTCDAGSINAVRVTIGKVVHVVDLAPRSRATFPCIEDTFAPGTPLLSTSPTEEIKPATGRYYGIRSDESCETYCRRLGLPWPPVRPDTP